MKVDIKTENLLKCLQSIIGVVERKQTMPILANILIDVMNEGLSITATDLEVELIATTSVSSTENGSFTLPGRKLLDICRALPSGSDLVLQKVDSKISISSGRSKFSLSTLPENEFPLIKGIDEVEVISVDQSNLKQLINKTHFSMAQQDVRYYLNGLLIESEGTQLRAVATDGHRLAISDTDLTEPREEKKQVILPRKGVIELQRLLDETGKIEVLLGTNHIRVKFDDVCFTSKLIDGNFPEYQRVIPANPENKLKVNTEKLKGALARAAILSNEKYRGIRLTAQNNDLVIQAHNPEQEQAEVKMDVEYSGIEIEIGFNVNYLIDALNAIDSEDVHLLLMDNNSSCLIEDTNNSSYKFVIMPMRL
tara:strand:- start:1309 stop:2406 length:1098 start_codon:yes stop_codon:yes gene_type:complete